MRVLDIIDNEQKIAICDISATAHMPDVLEYPYRPEIANSGEENEKNITYIIGEIHVWWRYYWHLFI